MPEKYELRQMQALPLQAKIVKTQLRIREWYNHFDGDVYVSFSGGKDSTVLAHLVHDMYPDVPLVFSNTGLEFPEIQSFARKMGAEFIRPKMNFSEVISKYGYPIISKETAEAIQYARIIRKKQGTSDYSSLSREYKTEEGGFEKTSWKDWRRQSLLGVGHFAEGQSTLYNKSRWLPLCQNTTFNIGNTCCNVMKKNPMNKYQKQTKTVPIIGTLAEESKMREQAWCRHGCNAFDGKHKTSQPLSFWTEQDILRYIFENNIEICSVYGDIVGTDKDGHEYVPLPGMDCSLKCTGCSRTGCIFCGFGCHLEKGESRFQMLARTHPRQYEYCMEGGQWVNNPKYDPSAPKMDGDWTNWNPKRIWVPSKEGLGFREVFRQCNDLYGKDFIRYE